MKKRNILITFLSLIMAFSVSIGLTTTKAYAEETPVEYSMGDANLDGNVNTRDVVLIKQSIVGLTELTDKQKVFADVYADGNINTRDVVLIQQSIVGMDADLGVHEHVFEDGICICGYLEPHTHEYSEFKFDDDNHWYECSCGVYETKENHIPGASATETTDQKCTECDYVITPALGHVHTLHLTKVNASEQSCTEEGNTEYYICSCGKWFKDNTATTEIIDKSSVVIAKDAHKYENLKKSATEHWWECSCGAYETKENHEGGTATCQQKATCSVCDTIYGNLGEHSPKTAWVITDTHHYHECAILGCSEKLNYQEHSFTNYVSDKNATYESDGTKTATCDGGCGKTHTVTDVGSMLIKDEIRFTTLTVTGKNVYGKVSNATTKFVFYEEIFVSGNATYIVDNDQDCSSPINSKTVDLAVGDNTFYVLETVGNNVKLYTVVIHRREMFTVTFNTNGGTAVDSQTVEEDAFATAPTTSKTGYTFAKWDYDFNTPITSDITITAGWNAIEYDIVYNLNNGNLATDKNKYTIEQAVTFDNPTRDYYTFSGWYNNANFTGSKITKITIGTCGEIELYAKWTPINYSITYYLNGGINDKNNPSKFNVETDTITFKNATKTGYTFDGWYLEETFNTNVTRIEQGSHGDITLYAKWTVNVNGLNFDGNGNTSGAMSAIALKTGETKALPLNTFVKNGYAFKGWATSANGEVVYNDGANYTMGTESQYILYAVWEANLNTLTFNGNGADSGSTSSMQIRTDATVTLNANGFTKTGYHFVGWSTTANGEVVFTDGANYTIGTESLYTIYAVWEVNLNTIIFNGNGATSGSTNSMQIHTGVTAILNYNGFAKTGYHFVGWSTSANGEVEYLDGANYTMGTASQYILYAVWEGNLNSINFNGNGATSGTMSSIQARTGDTITLPRNLFYLSDDYTFGGWSISETADCEYYNEANYVVGVEPEQTLYAYWKHQTKNGLIWSLNNNEITITDCLTSVTNVVIPSTIANYPVTWIYYSAFSDCASLASVTINSGSISDYAFYGCTSLASVTIGENVTGIGRHAFENCYSLNEINFNAKNCDDLSSGNDAFHNTGQRVIVIFGDKVERIPENLFYAHRIDSSYGVDYVCPSIRSVTIGKNVTSIGEYAFYRCNRITKVNYLGTMDQWAEFGLNAFSNGYDLYINDILITNAVLTTATKISASAFSGCDSLTSITIPNSVTSIGNSAFSYCPSLTSIEIPSSVINMGNSVFMGCSGLTSITIPNSVTSIGSYAFEHCSSLTGIAIPNSVTSIGDYAFRYCNLLTSATIPNSVTSIGSYAFYNCSSLTGIAIPDSVTSIGEAAFGGCSSLKEITIPFVGRRAGTTANDKYQYPFGYIFGTSSYTGGVETTQYYYGSSISSKISSIYYIPSSLKKVTVTGGNILNGAFYGCSLLTSVKIGSSVTSIGHSAFYNCNSLTSVVIGSSITSIGSYAFYCCSSLTGINIPDSVTSIGSYAFYYCELLTSVVIGNSLTSIDSVAFYGCSSLKSVYYAGTAEEWDNISIYSSNSLLTTATRYYYVENESDVPTDGGNYWHYDENGEIEIWHSHLYEITVTAPTCTEQGYTTYSCHCGDSYITDYVDAKGHSFEKSICTECGFSNLAFTLSADETYYSVTGIGECEETEIIIPETYNGKPVKEIGVGAFNGVKSFERIIVPKSITKIGANAFYGTSLTEIEIENDENANHSKWNITGYAENKYWSMGGSWQTSYHEYEEILRVYTTTKLLISGHTVVEFENNANEWDVYYYKCSWTRL